MAGTTADSTTGSSDRQSAATSINVDVDASGSPIADAFTAEISDELEQTVRLATIGSMAAGVAHEINNLLTPVLAYAQMAQSDPEMMPKAIAKTVAGIQSACTIVDAILGFARDDADGDVAGCDIDSVIDASLACMARDLEKDQIELRRTIDPHARPQVPALILQQVLLNLILNARDAMSNQNAPRILSIVSTARADGGVMMTVSDSGPGISADVADTLFEPFTTTKTKPTHADAPIQSGGSGLGLSVCRHLLAKHAGTIDIEPPDGRGATFLITLAA
ncbi:MAG: HAMP domain-containing sensor histidine kinase [Planctomycetota bacterium]